MAIVTRTTKQRLANRPIISSRLTLTWASRINKLARETAIVQQAPGRHAVGRPLSEKRQRELTIHGRMRAGRTLKSGPN
jgi:hypothetical protein